MDEPTFIQILTIIANRHGCCIREWDFDNHVVDIDGPDECMADCAVEIGDVLGKYAL